MKNQLTLSPIYRTTMVNNDLIKIEGEYEGLRTKFYKESVKKIAEFIMANAFIDVKTARAPTSDLIRISYVFYALKPTKEISNGW